MTHLKRIIALYSLLKQGSHTTSQLADHSTPGASRSRSQVDRDLKEVRLLTALHNEQLVSEHTGHRNQKQWKIVPNETAGSLNNHDLTTYFISRAVLPGVFTNNRRQSLDALQKTLEAKAISSSAVKYKSGVSQETFTNSNFYENQVTDILDSKLNDLLELIGQNCTITINRLSGDSTSVSNVFFINDCVWPIKIIFHRGCFYIATVRTTDDQVLVFQIDHIDWTVNTVSRKSKNLQDIVDKNLENRFGITQNYNEHRYDIQLLFSETTGKFVEEQNWHHSQKIERKITHIGEVNYVMTLRCGINRELVGWLFQWMSNVKVLGPQLLIDLYNEQLNNMRDLRYQADNDPLEYTNKFAPRV